MCLYELGNCGNWKFCLLVPCVLRTPLPLALQQSECAQRLVACPYCQLELAFSQSGKHEEYCGTRTEPCPTCRCNVMLREQAVHAALCSSTLPPESNNALPARSPVDPAAWFETHAVRNLLRPQQTGQSHGSLGPRPSTHLLDSTVHNITRELGQLGRTNVAPKNTDFDRSKFYNSEKRYTLLFQLLCFKRKWSLSTQVFSHCLWKYFHPCWNERKHILYDVAIRLHWVRSHWWKQQQRCAAVILCNLFSCTQVSSRDSDWKQGKGIMRNTFRDSDTIHSETREMGWLIHWCLIDKFNCQIIVTGINICITNLGIG